MEGGAKIHLTGSTLFNVVLNTVVYLSESDEVVGGGALEEVASEPKPGGVIGTPETPQTRKYKNYDKITKSATPRQAPIFFCYVFFWGPDLVWVGDVVIFLYIHFSYFRI